MKAQLNLIALSLLLTFGCQPISTQSEPTLQTQKIPAKIIDSCAPFDGAAFQVSIADNIIVDIYKAPQFDNLVKFTFPATSQTGYARLLLPNAELLMQQRKLNFKPLTGEIVFNMIKRDVPVEGNFNFVTPEGERKQGTFKAVWQKSQITRF
ncbi:MAG: hypothetical protein DCF19_17260 [Pseudanabaena frigida]|uniref:Uncharacterized protein n=1 Tax=Pseudanabaena frigida TaxID=945775 RepID=A0A2W4VYJ9_9CYAN|nr:MAG: hypothetical protein DCF19_17260 [Pseudanabaena frigida]